MKKLFLLLAKHLDEMPGIMGDDMEEFVTLLDNVMNDPVDLLPVELVCRLENPEAFRMAVRMGLLKVRKGRVVPNVSRKILLAYLLGRLFSGDYPDGRGCLQLWGKGMSDFPSTELERYFHVRNLRQSRQKNLGFRVPNGHKLVDGVFVRGETF